MLHEGGPDRDNRLSYVAAGIAACAVLTAVDWGSTTIVLLPLLVLAPLIACSGGTLRGTLLVAVVAIGVSIPLGWVNDIGGSRRHWVGVSTTVIGGAVACWIARTGEIRNRHLAGSAPMMRRVDRLKAALATGRMGEWSWERATNNVTWDANVAMLFGIGADEFGGTFQDWIALVDERDRPMVQEAVAVGVAGSGPFRFDHRCVWPDESIHWIEGIGDVIIGDENGQVIGAFGLAIDVDQRHREIEERNRLLEVERRQRERMEYLAKVDVLAYSFDTAEIVKRVTESMIPELGEWCSIVVSIDRRREHPSITVAHSDPDKVAWAEKIQREFPYDPDAEWGAAKVIRSGRREVILNVDPAVFALPGGEILREAGLRSMLTVPVIGALGTLGALQLIRCDGQPPFAAAEIALVDELAGRLGAALNSAVLFDRQTRSRAALDTLQQVSGRIASVATTDRVAHEVLTYGCAGIRADGGVLFLVDDDDDGELTFKESTGTSDTSTREGELAVAQKAIDAGSVVIADLALSGSTGAALGVPLQILNRVSGSLVFTFSEQREFTSEELSMLVTLGSRCAGALERASLYERDRDIALTFQRRLMPALPRTPEWIEVAAGYRPATGMAIGGDWYQVLEAAGGRIAAVVGDAVGHGLVAAAAMGQLRASIATAVAMDPEPNRAMAAVDLFAVQGADTLGASAIYVLFDPDVRARYTSAGHVPVVRVPARGPSELLEGGRRPLLGFHVPEEHSLSADFPFDAGDIVVMFTDGLIERRGETIDDGLKRLLDAVEKTRHLSPHEMCGALLEQLTDGYEPEDDVALLVIRRH